MRLVRFVNDGQPGRPGLEVPEEEVVVDLPRVGDEIDIGVPNSTRALFQLPNWRDRLSLLATHALDNDTGLVERDSIALRAPIEDPQKVVCVGLNYREHIEETDEERPENPVLFSKYPSAIVGPDDPIVWDPELTEEVDFEVELAVIVGKRTRRVATDRAREYVAGYTVANDVSARDLQFADGQWVRGKSLDTFCPLGPAIVTEEELGDPEALMLWSDLEDERMQESTTADLIFGIDELVSFCSDAFTLVPGDVILTGTPPGVGAFRDPPVLLEEGNEIAVGVEGIGELTNPCRYDHRGRR